jgi:quinoprotein glucose dehydrogenase
MPRNYVEWPVIRGDPKGNQYSALAQIHAANVHQLEVAWEYHTGDAALRGSSMYSNPIVVDGLMYVSTPALNAVALDPRTGREVWRFDSSRYNQDNAVIRLRNRGVAYWKGPEGQRIFHFVKDRVYAIDAKSGALITSFGKNGFIDLRENLGVDPARVSLEMTSPGAVYKNLLILGSRVNESYDASPGHIRAFDAVTGAFTWIFRTIPKPSELGHDTWEWVPGENYGGANAWGGVTIDEKRELAFCATGSATEDFYGGFRKGNNLFANCVLALDVNTGKRKWHYQTVRHDIWDYDNPSAPVLATIKTGNASRDVVVQFTKMGLTFVLDRETGEPIFPVVEMPVARSNVPGEVAALTQPFPLRPEPLSRLTFSEADLTNSTPEAREHALREFRKYVSGSLYTPPTTQGTITTPGFYGGVEWHGGSFDPSLNVIYVNANDAPTIHSLRPIHDVPAASLTPIQAGRQIYEQTCMGCHGVERQGAPPLILPLVNLKLSQDEIATVIRQGRNVMPAFPHFRPRDMSALVAYLLSPPSPAEKLPPSTKPASRYTVAGYSVFRDSHGMPGISPPWGTLNAIDLARGEILWKVPLGEYPELVAKGIRHTGTLNFGGAVATAGGLVFIAATADEKFRAFEKHSGRLLWEHQLPAGGYATPSIYMIDGRQHVVIAAGGGGKNATKTGDSIVAFALPETPRAKPDSKAASLIARRAASATNDEWIELFDGKTLNGWVHMNGSHTYTVEDGAIVGRTVEGSVNSFLCTLEEFGDFELELETTVDAVTNQGIQFRSGVKPMLTSGKGFENAPGRVYGPQAEVRRTYKGQPTTGMLYGEALGTGWLSSKEKLDQGHRHFIDEGWNKLRIVAKGPRLQTWVNGQPIDEVVSEKVYQMCPKGFVALQIHGINSKVPLIMKWRNIRIRPLH